MSKTPTLFDPFREIVSLRDDMDRVFDSMLRRYPQERGEMVWAPAIDVEENESAIIVRAELPGMKKEDIKVSISGDSLTISGERKHAAEEKGKTFHRIERFHGRFIRTIDLPEEVEIDKANAVYKAGVLHLELPKTTKAKSREIKISEEK